MMADMVHCAESVVSARFGQDEDAGVGTPFDRGCYEQIKAREGRI